MLLDSTNGGDGNGTSESTPIWAGMIALLSQKNGVKGLGLVSPHLHQLAGTNAFHDITACTDIGGICTNQVTSTVPGYSVSSGYDLTTGLGSFDGFNLYSSF